VGALKRVSDRVRSRRARRGLAALVCLLAIGAPLALARAPSTGKKFGCHMTISNMYYGTAMLSGVTQKTSVRSKAYVKCTHDTAKVFFSNDILHERAHRADSLQAHKGSGPFTAVAGKTYVVRVQLACPVQGQELYGHAVFGTEKFLTTSLLVESESRYMQCDRPVLLRRRKRPGRPVAPPQTGPTGGPPRAG
jgi:hypothetical protein